MTGPDDARDEFSRVRTAQRVVRGETLRAAPIDDTRIARCSF